MTEFIRHRVNKIDELRSLKKNWGAEIDLRSSVSDAGFIHLSHDPWKRGESFAERNEGTRLAIQQTRVTLMWYEETEKCCARHCCCCFDFGDLGGLAH